MFFSELGLSEDTMKAINDMGFSEATEIQAKAIPAMMSGADIIGRSNTGTGKTAAFGLPLAEKIKRDNRAVQAIILCPTRELAMQAYDELVKFSRYKPWIKVCAVYGGASMEKQIFELKKGVRIVVGTPGRVMDHIRRRTLKLDNIETVVLDEADEMLNMGFREDIEAILEYVPEERQTVLFSATMPPEILAITDRFQRDPIMIKVENKTRTVESVEQYYFDVPAGRKTDALKLLLSAYEPKLSMVFCNTKKMVDELCEALVAGGFKAAELHGDMKQQSRTQVMNAFRSGRLNILIATDVAARGIDVDDIDAVFNYDIPQDNEYYIHRIGRTGRAGKSGAAYTLISGRRQLYELRDISRFTNAEISERELPDKEEVIGKKLERVSEKIKAAADENKYPESRAMLEKIMAEGYSAEDIAAALLGMRMSKDMRNIPEFERSAPKPKERRKISASIIKLEISAGKKQKIAPNYIIGALTEATSMPGKVFGKIDIKDNFSTVEVPAEDADKIISAIDGKKINGKKVSVGIFGGDNFRRAAKSGKPFRHDKSSKNRPRPDRSFSNKNKRHQ